MKPNPPNLLEYSKANAAQITESLLLCLEEFHAEGMPPLAERGVRLAFGNSVYLAANYPEDARRLREDLEADNLATGFSFEELQVGLRDFRFEAHWLSNLGSILRLLPAPTDQARVQLAFLAGLHAAESLPDFVTGMKGRWNGLDTESRFLASRLLRWRLTGWKPEQPPFLEYMAGFYTEGTISQRLIVGATAEAYAVARSLPDSWGLRHWAETGWDAGRRAIARQPAEVRAMVDRLDKDELPFFVNLYRSCIIRSVADDGAIRPDRATLRFFALRHGRDYAAIYLRGDQPRLIAHAAFDFCFWMGVLSTQPIPCQPAVS